MTILNPWEWWAYYGSSGGLCNAYVFSDTNPDKLTLGAAFTGNLRVQIASDSETGIHPDILLGREVAFVASTDVLLEPEWIQYQIEAVAIEYIVDETFNGRAAYAKDGVWNYLNMGKPSAPPVSGDNIVPFTNPSGVTGTWYFGDGNSSTEVDPTHEYTIHGTYNVLFGSDTGADDLAIEVIVAALPLPTASFTATPRDPDSNIYDFVGSGGDTYSWLIGGADYTGQSVTHTFLSTDTYLAGLVITDENNSTDYAEETLDVLLPNILPVVDLQYVSDRLDHSFTSNATDPDGDDSNLAYAWDFGDGIGSSNLRDPDYTYLSDGEITVTLTVTDERGGVTVDTTTFTVSSTFVLGSEIMPNPDFDTADTSLLVFQGCTQSIAGGELTATATDPSNNRVEFRPILSDGVRYLAEIRVKKVSANLAPIYNWAGIEGSIDTRQIQDTYETFEIPFYKDVGGTFIGRVYLNISGSTGDQIVVDRLSVKEIL